ncbi:MAG: elongation factor Ts [Rickettsiales bacterium]|nr:elongation factor Ts [Rickettsiales bacterium]|tara:strand:- start:5773 stop:6666 length:894 start_codon:yes stop_codon:yes gene_type:complete
MPNITLIKKLREETGSPMGDCNKALSECNDNYEQAIDWLRKKGLSSASKKAGRVAAEGVVAIKNDAKKAVILEVNTETDFVARNDKFQDFVSKLLDSAINYQDKEKFISDNEDNVKEQIGLIGENIKIRRIDSLSLDNDGVIVSYIHNKINDNLGKIAVIIALKSDAQESQLNELGKQIAMHIAAAKPDSLNIENIDSKKLEREVDILSEQAKSSGKPQNIVDKMVEGRIRKYYEEVVLMEQFFVMDDKIKIKDLLNNFSKNNGTTEIIDFKMFILGEGIEKEEDDFAAEVASMTKL